MEFGDFPPFDRQVCDFLVKYLKLRETKAPKLENFQWEPPNLIAEHVQRMSLVQIFLRVKTCSVQMLTSPEYDISLTMEGNLVKGNKAGRLLTYYLDLLNKECFIFTQVRVQGGAREEKNSVHLLLCNAHYNMSVS